MVRVIDLPEIFEFSSLEGRNGGQSPVPEKMSWSAGDQIRFRPGRVFRTIYALQRSAGPFLLVSDRPPGDPVGIYNPAGSLVVE